jgi:superfamily I DNA/RNA helicase
LAENPNIKLSFEGDINSYVFSNDGSIYDVFNLMTRRPANPNYPNKLQERFVNFANLLDYIDETKDGNLKNMVTVVQKYGPRIFDLVKKLRKNNYPRKEADVVLSTVHKAKGGEFDVVELTEGFITENEIRGGKYKENKEQAIEEINILYVALTRAKNLLKFPDNFLARDTGLKESKFDKSKMIKPKIKKEEVEEDLEKPF